jgi:Cu2+-exporting ATPase
VKDRLALERARDLSVVIFDKTGTLTGGVPVLLGIVTVSGIDEGPIAKAIVSGASRRGVKLQQSANFRALPGRGASAL